MTDDINPFDAHREDDDATRVLGALYAPPGGEAYWDALHARIMGYVLASENGWWTAFGSWKRLGLAAAAVAVVAVGLGTRDTREAETRASYEAVLDDTTAASTYERVTRTPGLSENEAMFRYVISYR